MVVGLMVFSLVSYPVGPLGPRSPHVSGWALAPPKKGETRLGWEVEWTAESKNSATWHMPPGRCLAAATLGKIGVAEYGRTIGLLPYEASSYIKN